VSAATKKDIPDDLELAFGAAALIWFVPIGYADYAARVRYRLLPGLW
jgi:hypothetical protein